MRLYTVYEEHASSSAATLGQSDESPLQTELGSHLGPLQIDCVVHQLDGTVVGNHSAIVHSGCQARWRSRHRMACKLFLGESPSCA